MGLVPTEAENKRGFVLFQRNRNLDFYPHSRPGAGERLDTLEITAARGQGGSAVFGIHALRDLARVLASGDLKVEDVVFHVIRGNRRHDNDSMFMRFPVFLDSSRPAKVIAGESRFFWVTLPGDGPAGVSRGAITLVVDKKKVKVPLRVEVLPFTLTEKGGPAFGAFVARADFPVEEMAFLKKSGINALQWFWGANMIEILNDQGSLKLDFSRIDAFMEKMKASGMSGPVVLSLGNDRTGHYERALCNAFNLPLYHEVRDGKEITVADTVNPAIDTLFVRGVKTILDRAREQGWPRIVFLIYDEALERLMPWQARWYRLLKNAIPEIEVYGVFHQPDGDLAAMADVCDIMVCNRGFQQVRDLALERKKELWCYANCAADESFGMVRFLYGQIPSYWGAKAMFFWSYNYYQENPWNDFDAQGQGDADWVIVYPPADGKVPTRTVAFMGMVEAVSDARYLATLGHRVMEKAPERWPSLRDTIRAMQAKMFEGVKVNRMTRGPRDFFVTTDPAMLDSLRGFVVREMMRY